MYKVNKVQSETDKYVSGNDFVRGPIKALAVSVLLRPVPEVVSSVSGSVASQFTNPECSGRNGAIPTEIRAAVLSRVRSQTICENRESSIISDIYIYYILSFYTYIILYT